MAPVVQTSVKICNMALGHVAATRSITSLSDTTQEAIACARFYEQVRDEVLREFPWPFAWRMAPLELVDGSEDIATTLDFQYSYRLPSDLLRVHRVLGLAAPAIDSRVPYSLGSDLVGGLLYTDLAVIAPTSTTLAQPQVEYIAVVPEADWPADFAQCVAFLLAYYIAPALTNGDQFKLGQRAFQSYDWALNRAKLNAAKEQETEIPGDSEFITVRG